MKTILGLDLGTNSIGWALIETDFNKKEGQIKGIGSRIIPMSQDIIGNFEKGQSHSQTAERTSYRGTRRLYQRDNLRRERLHRVLNILGFLPEHYRKDIDFEKKLGQFKNEVKLNYKINDDDKYEFLFMDSFNEMLEEIKRNNQNTKIPYDWTLYYLRKKALKEKISKQELAWVILNFNQKRGYYQLRGDELSDMDSKKDERYYLLTVKEVKETEDKNARGTWHEVKFEETDAIYKRQSKEPLNNWVGTKKDFIITTSTNKDGSTKQSFRAPKEDDWGLVKKKTEQELEHYINDDIENKSVGSYIYDILLQRPTQKIRGKLIKTIERKYYKKELEAILAKQTKFHSELKDKNLYQDCLNDLYKHNEAHKNNIKDKSFKDLFIQDIIFYQRPLKSQKGTIGGCQYESRSYKKTIFDKNTQKEKVITVNDPVKTISRSHPLFQEFRLWQWLHNLKIYEKERIIDGKIQLDIDVTNQLIPSEDNWIELFDFLKEKKEINQSQFLKYFSDKKLISKQKKNKNTHRWNYPEDKTYPMCETHSSFVNRFKKVNDFDIDKNLTSDFEENLWHIIYSVKDMNEYKQALKTFSSKNNIDQDTFSKAFIKYPPFKNDYASYSKKALNKLLPLMRKGKYWNEKLIPELIKGRITAIMERINTLELPESYSTKNINEALEKVTDDDIQRKLIKSFLPFKDKTNPYSGLNTYQAGYAVYNRHSEYGDIKKWRTSEDIENYLNNFRQHSLRNPIVEQLVLETLRTVKDIWDHYGDGKENVFDEIHVELGREMKNPSEKRKNLSEKNTENERTNARIRELLKEMTGYGARPHSPSHQEILKIYEEDVVKSEDLPEDIEKIRKNNSPGRKDIERYKLWLDQKYISPYTGKFIPLSKLFSEQYQIEHIIPQSRYFDNSFNNKVICESAVNELKSNQTAYEFIKDKGGAKIDLGNGNTADILKWENYELHCNSYFKKNRFKLKNLLTDEIPEGFINRQLNDSRYISKLVKGLLSNIVRNENEQEATSKNLIPVTGAITSKLKHDWGLNDKWNELILPRFIRLNKLTQTEDFTTKNINGITIPTVPDDLIDKFNKKRIDHRHHALDALVIAACTRKHIQYINSLNNEKEKHNLQPSLLTKNKEGRFTKHFQLPWQNFPVDVLYALETTIVSFKQNLRVINKTNNKYWKYVKQDDGTYKKKKVKQTKGDNWAIRKPLHKESVYGKLSFNAPKGKVATAIRTSLSEIKKEKHIEQITDRGIREIIIPNHLKNYTDEKGKINFEQAFSPEGIQELNNNIIELNNGKRHNPIYKVRFYEVGSRFPVSENTKSAKHQKYVEAAKGTNLFFAIYLNEKKQKREYETIPLNEVIAHQKQEADLPKEQRTGIPIDHSKGKFLFSLSPNDLVYVPTDEEIDNPNLVDFRVLNNEQIKKIYKMVSSSGFQCFFIRMDISKLIFNKMEFSALNKMEKSTNEIMIKERCWKLETDRLGNIIRVYKQ